MDEIDVAVELKKAKEALKAAENLNKHGLCDSAASRIYYAAFHAARAAVVKVNPDAKPQTHKGTAILYAKEVVQTGKAPAEFSSLLGRLQTARERADYGVAAAPCDVDGRSIQAVKRMVRHARGL